VIERAGFSSRSNDSIDRKKPRPNKGLFLRGVSACAPATLREGLSHSLGNPSAAGRRNVPHVSDQSRTKQCHEEAQRDQLAPIPLHCHLHCPRINGDSGQTVPFPDPGFRPAGFRMETAARRAVLGCAPLNMGLRPRSGRLSSCQDGINGSVPTSRRYWRLTVS
jgi:hypothetical protein